MESWAIATSRQTRYTQEQLVKRYGIAEGFQKGALRPPYEMFVIVAQALDMDHRLLPAAKLNPFHLAGRLRSRGHLILVYNVTAAASHAVVVYGLGYPSPEPVLQLAVMNPGLGGRDPQPKYPQKQKGAHERMLLDYLQGGIGDVIVGYPRAG